jgi:3',5'-cyclic-AMP phosphodiesterase
MKSTIQHAAFLILLIWLLSGCEDAFEYSPFSVIVDNRYSETQKRNRGQLDEMSRRTSSADTFRLAVIADSHSYFDELAQAVDLINRDTSIRFVLHAGDMADGGMLQEYELFHRTMSRLNVPWFTVIGNHDVLANGRAIYNQMFGPENYTLNFGNTRFIIFNNILLELTPELPDFEWLEEELAKAKGIKNVFVIAHVPPWDDTYSDDANLKYTGLLQKYGNVRLSIHGHHHNPVEQIAGHLTYLVTGAPQRGVFRTIDVQGQNVIINTVQLNPQP